MEGSRDGGSTRGEWEVPQMEEGVVLGAVSFSARRRLSIWFSGVHDMSVETKYRA